MMQRKRLKLGEILLAQGYITEEQLQQALEQHKRTGISLGTVLVNMGAISEKDLDRFCKEHPMLARYQRPRIYKFVPFEELPFNDSGKKLHHVLKARAQKDFPNLD